MSLLWVEAAEQGYVNAYGEPVTEPVEHITHHDLAKMYSGDYDVRMPKVKNSLRRDYLNYQRGKYAENPHGKDIQYGGPDNYIDHLKQDIAQNGFTSPLEIRGGNVVTDGNHRGVAALEMRHMKIPVVHRR